MQANEGGALACVHASSRHVGPPSAAIERPFSFPPSLVNVFLRSSPWLRASVCNRDLRPLRFLYHGDPMRRLALRFAFVYLTLFILMTQISGSMLPNLTFSYRGLGRLSPFRDLTHVVAESVFGIARPLDDFADGEPLFFWIQTAWVLLLSIAITAAWSALDRRRANYDTLYGWFTLFVRIALAASLFEYGMTKVIPTQFPAPPLTTLVTPVGHLSLSALLWTSIGAAQPYEIFTGCIEVLAGVLVLIPRTTVLGAMLAIVALTQVLALNMAYDVGLKLVTMHLIALALLLIAPDLSRFADFFVRHEPATTSLPAVPPARTRWARRVRALAPLVFGAYALAMWGYINWTFWHVAGDRRPRSALYGIWNVEQLSVDGNARPAELNDYDRRWRRVIFDTPDVVVFQRTDDSLASYGAAIDTSRGSFDLTKGSSRLWRATFLYERPHPDRLTIAGEMDGHRIEAQLRQVPFDTLPLLNSSFRWIRPHRDRSAN